MRFQSLVFLWIGAFVVPGLVGLLLASDTPLPRWFLAGLNIGLALGTGLVMFFFITSIYIIGIACPWCIVVWAMTIPQFCAVTAYTLRTGVWSSRIAANPWVQAFTPFSLHIAGLWLFVIAASIVLQFWSFFSSWLS